MCLDILSEKSIKEATIEKLEFDKDGYTQLWKVFDIGDKESNEGHLLAQFHNFSFKKGKNTAEGDIIFDFMGWESSVRYEPGFHCFLTEKEAGTWQHDVVGKYNRKRIVVPVKVKKSWITSIGIQDDMNVTVCKHIFI